MVCSHVIRSFTAGARHTAVAWWAGQTAESARCDVCCRELRWGEGYLLPAGQIPERWRGGRRGLAAGALPVH
jgi:hypothetical protein